MRIFWFAVLAACSGGSKDAPSTGNDADTDTDADSDSDTDVDTDADSDADSDTEPTPTGDTGPPAWLLQTCPASPPTDTVQVASPSTDIAISGNELVVTLGYGCGCAQHQLGGCFGTAFGPETTPTLDLFVLHDANGEMCEAFCFDEVRVNLGPVEQQFDATYGAASGTVDLVVRWNDYTGAQQQVVTYGW